VAGKGAPRQELRPYQQKALDDARAAYRAGRKSVLLVAPTGAGKTRMGVEVCTGAVSKGRPVLWLAHRDELLGQARDRLLAEGLPRVGLIQAGEPSINAPVQVASIQTLVARAKRGLPPAGIVVFDEAHHYAASTWSEVANAYAGVPRLGLTATPERGDGVGLGDLFDTLIQVSTVRELQETNDPVTGRPVLVRCVTYAPSTPTKDLSQDPVAAYLARTPGERAFVFCANVAHAEKTAIAFTAAGVPAATIHADTPWLLRRARLEAFRRQDPQPLREAGVMEPAPLALCNVYALTEGVDVPEATCCILARGCGHPGMMLQAVGRVLRAAPGKERAVFLDLRGRVHKLGLPEADREWSLEGKAAQLSDKDRDVKLKECPACNAMVGAWKTDRMGWRICPQCRERVSPPESPQVAPRELHQMGAAASPAAKKAALATLAKVAVTKGRKSGWIAFAYKEKFGAFPPFGAAAEAWRDAGGGWQG
jgi:superfamily II DNA or RNA helicase